ncbi:MAG: hypothetical protein ACRD3W_10270, partial [Terriglobales bacterium]
MTPVFPTLPTDNLYKFLALFGLVILVFGIAFPEEKLARSLARLEEAQKAGQIAHIRIHRKTIQAQEALNQIKDKSAELNRINKLLKDAETTLEAKRKSLSEQANQQIKQRNLTLKAAKETEAQVESLNPELHALDEKVRQYVDDVRKYTEAIQPIRVRAAELEDEIAIEDVNSKAFTEEIKGFGRRIILWDVVTFGSIIVGFVLMIFGFGQWHKKVQVYQDAILRKQAGDIE